MVVVPVILVMVAHAVLPVDSDLKAGAAAGIATLQRITLALDLIPVTKLLQSVLSCVCLFYMVRESLMGKCVSDTEVSKLELRGASCARPREKYGRK